MTNTTYRRLRAPLVAALAVAAFLVGPGAGVAAAAPSVTVTPDTDLVSDSVVTVEVDGLEPGANVVVTQCSATRCVFPIHFVIGTVQQYNTANSKAVTLDGTGSADVVLRLSSYVAGDICWADRCRIGVFPSGTIEQDPAFPPELPNMFSPIVSAATYTAPLSFVTGTTVTPSTGVLDQEPVTVVADTPVPYGSFLLQQCAGDVCAEGPSGLPYLPANAAAVTSDADGRIAGSLLLHRVLDSPGGTADCLVVQCSVRILSTSPLIEEIDRAPVSFAATGSYVWPEATLNVANPGGAVDGGRVGVAGSGYSRWALTSQQYSAGARFETCRAVPDPDPSVDCVSVPGPLPFEPIPRGDIVRVPDGQVAANATARTVRTIALPSGPWDCAVRGCTVALSQGANPVSNRVPITWASPWAPWRSADHFFADGYRRVHGTAATALDRQVLTAPIENGSATVADALYQAALVGDTREWSSVAVVGDTVRMYRAFFDRYADSAGLQYWVGRRRAAMTGAQMARAFGGTPEFRAVYGSVSNREVVRRAYRNTLGREGEAAGIDYWTARLDQGMARATLIHNFARSRELGYREADRVAVTIVAFELAGRSATAIERSGDPDDSIDARAGTPAAGIADILAGTIMIGG